MGITGRGIKFEVREKAKYRSRSGYAQCDGISQFSGDFLRRSASSSPSPPKLTLTEAAEPLYSSDMIPGIRQQSAMQPPQLSFFDSFYGCRDGYPVRDHHFQSLRGSWSKSSSSTSLHRLPQHQHYDVPHSSPPLSTSPSSSNYARPYSNDGRLQPFCHWASGGGGGGGGRTARSMTRKPPQLSHALSLTNFHKRGPSPAVRYQNYVYVSDNDEDCSIQRTFRPTASSNYARNKNSKGSRQRSKRSICNRDKADLELAELRKKEAHSRPTSREGINCTYDFLFERHLRALMNLESDVSDAEPPQDDVEEKASLTESEQLSVLGDELVDQSITDVTDRIMRRAPLTNGGTTKKVSFGPETKDDDKSETETPDKESVKAQPAEKTPQKKTT